MNCRWVADNWTAHRDGALPDWQDALWRAHVAVCPKCPGFIESMEATVDVLAATPPEPAPDEMKRRLLDRLRNRPG